MRGVLAVLGLATVVACGGSGSSGSVGGENSGEGSGSSGSTSGGSDNGSGSSGLGSDEGSGSLSGSGSSGSLVGSGSSGGGSGESGSSGGGSGSSGSSGTGSSGSGSSSGSSSGGTTPSMLPTVSGTCPTVATGSPTFAGEQVQIWTGTKSSTPGMLVMFWYPTGGNSTMVEDFLGQSEITSITSAGGVVASFISSNTMGTNTGDLVWYTGDFTTADQVVACAIKQGLVDPKRIYAMGASAGALQTTWMSYARSGYLAGVASYSGGVTGTGTGASGLYPAYPTEETLQDASHVPAALAIHGSEAMDNVLSDDFADGSAAWESDIAKKGGFSVDCDTGGGHVSGPPATDAAVLQFFQDHPYGVKMDYSSGLPSSFPSYCKVGPQPAK